jgi:predicted DNA-binding transcriptional regulator YafY
MADTGTRTLRLLSLMQNRRHWSGSDLAERLGVSLRTVRRDVERLRRLGYPVVATRGSVGGYRLSAGAAMPPLLLDDDEAVAIAVGLGSASGGAVEGLEETALRALTKLLHVLPPRLGGRVDALQASTVRVPGAAGAPT